MELDLSLMECEIVVNQLSFCVILLYKKKYLKNGEKELDLSLEWEIVVQQLSFCVISPYKK